MTARPLTVAEAAETTRLSKSLLYELCRLGKLKHYRVGARGKGRILIAPDDLDTLMRDCRVEDPADDDGPLKHFR
jgi:excisionase family DNA binding protein